jgi:two-component system, LytTR family, response regulator
MAAGRLAAARHRECPARRAAPRPVWRAYFPAARAADVHGGRPGPGLGVERLLHSDILTSIVDHDALSRAHVLEMLADDPVIRLGGVFATVGEAQTRMAALAPQLLIVNSHLPDGDSFELLRSLTRQGISPQLICVAACIDRSIEAFAAGAIDYLVTPLDRQRFARALGRAKVLAAYSRASGPATAAVVEPERSRLLISERGKVVVVLQRDIEFVQAAGTYIKIYAAGQCYQRRQSLIDIERSLDASRFVRVHRSTVVNIEHIAEMHSLFHGDYELVLRRGTRITLSRRYRGRLKPFLFG